MTKNLKLAILVICLGYFSVMLLWFNLSLNSGRRFSGFSQLATSFLKGELTLPFDTISEEMVFYGGKYYFHHEPFPAVLLAPFVYIWNSFGLYFQQGYLQLFLNVGIFYISWKLARKFHYTKSDSLYLAYAFLFASVCQAVALLPFSWNFAQIVCVFFTFLAIYEYFSNKRWFLIGVAMAVVFATRFTAGLAVYFFIAEILTERSIGLASKVRKLAQLLVPVAFACILLLSYNRVRFGDYFESGYLKVQGNENMVGFSSLFNVKNIPHNFYMYFIKIPLGKPLYLDEYPFAPSVSFFVISPVFIYLAKLRLDGRFKKILTSNILLTLVVLLSYYSPGWIQVGPRYVLDFLPYLFILLLYSFKNRRLSLFSKRLIIYSSIYSFLVFLNVYGWLIF